MLINNNYPNNVIDEHIEQFLKNIEEEQKTECTNNYKLYYRNQMNSEYKVDEDVIKRIVKNNVKTKDNETSISLLIYYKNTKTFQLVMRNNQSPRKRPLSQFNLTYEFKCTIGECKHPPAIRNNSYIGFTKCQLSRRISYHLSNGAIKKHYHTFHNKKVSRKEIENNIKIRYKVNDINRLQIYEALMIYIEKPFINQQDTGKARTLHLFS
jgi:hypothetical protein